MKKLLGLLVTVLCFSLSNAQNVTPVKGTASKFLIRCANLYFEVDSAMGARISSFKVDQNELMYVDFATTDMAGSTFWPSPQSVWNWPPAVNLDSKPYLSKIKGDTILFRGSTDTKSMLRFYKRIYASKADTSISITYVIKNEKTSAQTWAPWEITRVAATGYTIFNKGSGIVTGDMATRTRDINGFVWYDQNVYNSPGNKLFCDGQGWLAHVSNSRYLFIKKFQNITSAQKAPGEAEVEVYTAPNDTYTELENQGAYVSIPAKDSIKWTVKWYARALPAGVELKSGSKTLTDYISSVMARSAATSAQQPASLSVSCRVYPNPASQEMSVEMVSGSYTNVSFQLCDLQGRVLISQPLAAEKSKISVQSLQGGIYFYQFKRGNEILSKGKLSVIR